jgi:hypothetical protein
MIKVISIIYHEICWRPGSGLEIQVGRDCIMGLGKQFILSSGLIDALNH